MCWRVAKWLRRWSSDLKVASSSLGRGCLCVLERRHRCQAVCVLMPFPWTTSLAWRGETCRDSNGGLQTITAIFISRLKQVHFMKYKPRNKKKLELPERLCRTTKQRKSMKVAQGEKSNSHPTPRIKKNGIPIIKPQNPPLRTKGNNNIEPPTKKITPTPHNCGGAGVTSVEAAASGAADTTGDPGRFTGEVSPHLEGCLDNGESSAIRPFHCDTPNSTSNPSKRIWVNFNDQYISISCLNDSLTLRGRGIYGPHCQGVEFTRRQRLQGRKVFC
ncbi:uncharacterized protein LOC132386869 [Hypanus sabinus]|uniref:uncharacterized protein LOC132386869 n=1 Tax=Hypanus sabinus TaxID=79690 RepID=UPI0028C4AE1C|nr:uncharacterized protein LOC132386869 [Hypanus sabinus]